MNFAKPFVSEDIGISQHVRWNLIQEAQECSREAATPFVLVGFLRSKACRKEDVRAQSLMTKLGQSE